jgi:serine/threonine protein kinase
LPFHMVVRIARDIALGIIHLHKEKVHATSILVGETPLSSQRSADCDGRCAQVIHRDIATRNVLVGENYCTSCSSCCTWASRLLVCV